MSPRDHTEKGADIPIGKFDTRRPCDKPSSRRRSTAQMRASTYSRTGHGQGHKIKTTHNSHVAPALRGRRVKRPTKDKKVEDQKISEPCATTPTAPRSHSVSSSYHGCHEGLEGGGRKEGRPHTLLPPVSFPLTFPFGPWGKRVRLEHGPRQEIWGYAFYKHACLERDYRVAGFCGCACVALPAE